MPQASLGTVVRQLCRSLHRADGREVADAELLRRFAAQRDEGAFTTLMERHRRLVWSVCWNVLHHEQDVEDAFQATFLVLARQAGSIRHGATVASWLYRVAYRTALRARADRTRRLANEREAATMPSDKPASELAWRELQAILVAELDRLADKYRLPFLLCCLEGKSKSEAARELGWRDGTVSSRLALARKRMQERLARRGVVLAAVLCAGALAPSRSAAAGTRAFLESTVQAALAFTAGRGGAAALPGRVTRLARGVLRTMAISRIKSASLFLLVCGTLLGGAGFLSRQALADKPPPTAAEDRELRPSAPQVSDRKGASPADSRDQIALQGRVLDAAGKPLARAPVAIVATLWTTGAMIGGGGALPEAQILGRGQTDDQGHYVVLVPRKTFEGAHRVEVLAGGHGQALGRQEIKKKGRVADTELRLVPESVRKGRLIDLDGQPAAGVKVLVVRLGKLTYPAGRQYTMDADAIEPPPIFYQDFDMPRNKMDRSKPAVTTHAVQFAAPPADLPFWPKSVVTDAQGRFTLHGMAKGEVIGVQVRDERYAAVNLDLGPPAQGDTTVLALGPPHLLEGTVTDAVTGKPVPRARVHVDTFPDYFGGLGVVGDPADERGQRFAGNYYVSMGPQIRRSETWTDEHGHYRINPFQGLTQIVTISAPAGQPYLALRKTLGWKDGTLRQEWDVALPRGTWVRGRVVEDGTSTPVPNARIDCWSRDSRFGPAFGDGSQLRTLFPRHVQTAADGSFQVLLPTGKWHLLANAGPGSHPPRVVTRMTVRGPRTESDKPVPGDYQRQRVVVEDITVTDPKVVPGTLDKSDGKHYFHPDGWAAVAVRPGKDITGTQIVLRRPKPDKGSAKPADRKGDRHDK